MPNKPTLNGDATLERGLNPISYAGPGFPSREAPFESPAKGLKRGLSLGGFFGISANKLVRPQTCVNGFNGLLSGSNFMSNTSNP
jgi:hypothetical protein